MLEKLERFTLQLPEMLCWSHYKFRQRLIAKSELFSDCNVIECDELYTCKTCGYCGIINGTLGGWIVFKCNQENYQQKLIGSDRDIYATRII